jgi:hypothetical protein
VSYLLGNEALVFDGYPVLFRPNLEGHETTVAALTGLLRSDATLAIHVEHRGVPDRHGSITDDDANDRT